MFRRMTDGFPRSGSEMPDSSAYRRARDVARRLGLGRLRDRMRNWLNSRKHWQAVPPHRVKDLDPKSKLGANTVALTFDDGPNPLVTPQILDLLDEYDQRATFFVCGMAADRHPELVREAHLRGHSIGGHSWDHPHSGIRGLGDREWKRQVDDTCQILSALIGSPLRWFRPPRGIIDRTTWERLRRQGLTTVMWSIDGWDCKLRDPTVIAANVLRDLEPGSVVLLHDANATFLNAVEWPRYGEVGNQASTVDATRLILEGIASRELKSISLDSVPQPVMRPFGRPRISIGR